MEKMWAGRFEKATDKVADDFNSSIHFDSKMYKQDIKGSLEHAAMLCHVGILTEEDGRIEFSYEESEITGMEGSTTAISFSKDNPSLVSMVREGSVSTALVFEQGKRHRCAYNTPYMPFEISVHTRRVSNTLLENGVLELDYIIEIRGAKAERTKFRMELL